MKREKKTDKLAIGILLTLCDRSGSHFISERYMIVKKSAYSVEFWLKFSEQRSSKETKRRKNFREIKIKIKFISSDKIRKKNDTSSATLEILVTRISDNWILHWILFELSRDF